MNYFLVLKFRNAGLFRNHKDVSDKIFDLGWTRDRKNEAEFKEPITVHQISNMIHVLFGERPKPFNRFTAYSKIDYIYEMANNSYLRIDTYKDSDNEYLKQNIQLKKAVFNSYNPNSILTWERIKRLLGEDDFILFTTVLSDLLGFNATNEPVSTIKKLMIDIKDSRLDKLFEKFKHNGCSSLYFSIYGRVSKKTGKLNECVAINANPRTLLTVLTGLDKIIRLDGEILIPVNDEDIIKLKSGRGSATILDGGFVYIKGIKSISMVNPIADGFTLVSDLSLEQTTINKTN